MRKAKGERCKVKVDGLPCCKNCFGLFQSGQGERASGCRGMAQTRLFWAGHLCSSLEDASFTKTLKASGCSCCVLCLVCSVFCS